MQKSFIPEATKVEGSIFTGDVIIEIPSYDERMDMMMDSGLTEALQEKAANLDNESYKPGMSYHKALNNCVKLSYSRYVKINLTRKKDKKVYKDIEEFKYDPDAGVILQEIALKIATGSILGKA